MKSHLFYSMLSIIAIGFHNAQPVDTTVLVPCFGYMDNLINWYFINAQGVIDTANAGGQIPAFYVSRIDTAFVEINY